MELELQIKFLALEREQGDSRNLNSLSGRSMQWLVSNPQREITDKHNMNKDISQTSASVVDKAHHSPHPAENSGMNPEQGTGAPQIT